MNAPLNRNVFAFRLRRAMNQRSVKLKDFAKAVCRSEETVKKWRNGSMMPAFATVVSIANVLHVSIDFLTGRTDIMEIGGVKNAR